MKFRWKRVVLVLMPIAPVFSFPYGYRIINPKFYNSVRCIQQQDGELVKASGDACQRESSTILTLEHQS
jgi:hypothetical protein